MKTEGVQLICAMIFSPAAPMEEIEGDLENAFSGVEFSSPVMDFDHTDYYYSEMGRPLYRKFIAFAGTSDPSVIARAKLAAGEIEKKYARSGKRTVNIDPGYLEPSKLVLASTKNFYHRIYISEGIYAEITLRWRNGDYEHFDWTFPDYRTVEYKNVMKHIRELYMKKIRR